MEITVNAMCDIIDHGTHKTGKVEWTEKTKSWKKAWSIVYNCCAKKEDCEVVKTKLNKNLIIINIW